MNSKSLKIISGSLLYSEMIMYLCDTYLRTRKCKFILEYESGKFTWKRVSGHFPSSYPASAGLCVGLLLILFQWYSRTGILK